MVTVTFLSLSSLRSPFVIIPLSQVNYSLGRVRIGTQLAHSFCLPQHGGRGSISDVCLAIFRRWRTFVPKNQCSLRKKNLSSPLFLTGPEGGRPPSSFAFRCCRIFPGGEGEAPGPFLLLLTTARPRSGRARASPPAPPDGLEPGEGRWAPGAWMDAERWQNGRGGGGDRRRERKRGGEKKGEVLA